MRIICCTLGIAAVIACSAAAQEKATFIIDVVGGPVSPHNPSVTVKIYASFPSQYWAFGSTYFDLASTDTSGEFSGMTKPTASGIGLPPGPCSEPWFPGTPDGNGGLTGLYAFQFNAVGCFARTTNPIQIWEATWSTQTFTNRTVVVSTVNVLSFIVYTDHNQSLPNVVLTPNLFVPGEASIEVVPAPGALVIVGALTFAIRRRR